MWFFMPEELQDLFSAHRREQWLDWNAVEPMKYSLDQFSSWDSERLELPSRPHAHIHISPSYSGDGQKCVSLLELGAREPVPRTSCPFMLNKDTDCLLNQRPLLLGRFCPTWLFLPPKRNLGMSRILFTKAKSSAEAWTSQPLGFRNV